MRSAVSALAAVALVAVCVGPTVALGNGNGVLLYRKQHTDPSIRVPTRLLGRLLRQRFVFAPGYAIVVNEHDHAAVPPSIARHHRIVSPLPAEPAMSLRALEVMTSLAKQHQAQQPAVSQMLHQLAKELAVYLSESRLGRSAASQHKDAVAHLAKAIESRPEAFPELYADAQTALSHLAATELVTRHDKEISDHIGKRSLAHLIEVIQQTIRAPHKLAEQTKDDLGSLVYYADASQDVGCGVFAECEIPMGTCVVYGGRLIEFAGRLNVTAYSQIFMLPSDARGSSASSATVHAIEAEHEGNVTRFINHSASHAQFTTMPIARHGLLVPAYWALAPVPLGAQLLVPYTTDAVPRDIEARDLTPFEHLEAPAETISPTH